MREIKFNFYNAKTNKYTTWDDSNAGMSMSAFITHEHLKFLQFTGLNDKNGTPIYEGDIVEFDDCEGDSWNGYADVRNKGEVKYDNETISFYFTNRIDVDMHEIDFDELIVLGNIYENPELLEVDSYA